MSPALALWKRYQNHLCLCPSIGLSLDIARMNFSDDFLPSIQPAITEAYSAMDALEAGAIANPDEKRMVGHYWLRNPALAPSPELRQAITSALTQIKSFAADIHSAKIASPSGKPFINLLIIGIGGSALGPQFIADALTSSADKMKTFFFDNTDPDGMDRELHRIGNLAQTLTVVISKSGGTKETRNGMLAAQAAYQAANLHFAQHAVAVTGDGSELDQAAKAGAWLARFPMWDWVGGRTSVTSAVGLLPAALQGFDIDALLAGARDTDSLTRLHDTARNPAARLALMWFHAGSGKGLKDMVVLPYKDRLLLFSRYLQQLVMESLGKEKDLAGHTVLQGLAVYGNKGSTDQHAYVQQLREGINNFFVTFIEVLSDSTSPSAPSSSLFVEKDVTSGDYLHGFFQGTRSALTQTQRESITLTIDRLDARAIGSLIALFERAVGLYASLVNINAYHQPGVEAGKKAATAVINLQLKILTHLRGGGAGTAEQIAAALKLPDEVETIHLTLRHLVANPAHKIKSTGNPLTATYSA